MKPDWTKWRSLVEGKKFVWLLMPPWDNVWTRQNQFVLRLAELGADVLYVEFTNSWITSIKTGDWSKVPLLRKQKPRKMLSNLHVLSLSTQLPGGMRSNAVAAINGKLAASEIKCWIKNQGWDEYYCWCRVPISTFALDHLNPKACIYDITDDYGHFVQDPHVRQLVYRREERLLQKVGQVFLTAERLMNKGNLNGKHIDVIPNGVDYDLFSQVSNEHFAMHPSVASRQKPLIGFVGLTNNWVDFELLKMLGEKWPGQVMMVGPIDKSCELRVKSIPGLIWTGFVKDRAELPRYIKGFDVLIIPFLVNELTSNMNPLKIWEYLASGKPIISVDLPALDPVRDLVDVAPNPVNFVSMVENRIQHWNDGQGPARQVRAAQYSWDVIFDRMMGSLAGCLR